MKAEKYIITTEGGENPLKIIRWGFGAAGEEIQKLFSTTDAKLIRIRVVGPEKETTFKREKEWRLLDIKQKIKSLTIVD